MTPLERHHDLALKILVGRALALKSGLPWSLDEDQKFIVTERALWHALSDADKAAEQGSLASLWQERGAVRTIVPDARWGAWTAGLGPVEIPDAAFGHPAESFRPHGKGIGVLTHENPALSKTLNLLWTSGFQPSSVKNGIIVFPIPAHRVVAEAERLVGMLARNWPDIRLVPFGTETEGVKVQAIFDPATGQAALHLTGVEFLQD